jgi:hypothetical protein
MRHPSLSSPLQSAGRALLVFINANRKNPQAHEITVATLHPKVFKVSYFPKGTEVLF